MQGATTNSDWSRGHAWAMYGWTAVQRYLRDGSACAVQYTAANLGVMDSLLDVAVNVSESFLRMLPAQLQVCCCDVDDGSQGSQCENAVTLSSSSLGPRKNMH